MIRIPKEVLDSFEIFRIKTLEQELEEDPLICKTFLHHFNKKQFENLVIHLFVINDPSHALLSIENYVIKFGLSFIDNEKTSKRISGKTYLYFLKIAFFNILRSYQKIPISERNPDLLSLSAWLYTFLILPSEFRKYIFLRKNYEAFWRCFRPLKFFPRKRSEHPSIKKNFTSHRKCAAALYELMLKWAMDDLPTHSSTSENINIAYDKKLITRRRNKYYPSTRGYTNRAIEYALKYFTVRDKRPVEKTLRNELRKLS